MVLIVDSVDSVDSSLSKEHLLKAMIWPPTFSAVVCVWSLMFGTTLQKRMTTTRFRP